VHQNLEDMMAADEAEKKQSSATTSESTPMFLVYGRYVLGLSQIPTLFADRPE
jgi:hypothetical protein